MADPEPIETERRLRRARKRWELALFLPLTGALLFLTPLLSIFMAEPDSLTRTVILIFGLWALLIGAAYLLARQLRDEMGSG